MPLPYTAGFREVISGVLIPLSVKSVLLSRKKNIYRPLFSFVCSGSCTSMPVPVPCQTSAPPCPAMLFVATLSPAAGPRAGGTDVTPRQAQAGQRSDTPACLLITPAPQAWNLHVATEEGSTLGVPCDSGKEVKPTPAGPHQSKGRRSTAQHAELPPPAQLRTLLLGGGQREQSGVGPAGSHSLWLCG